MAESGERALTEETGSQDEKEDSRNSGSRYTAPSEEKGLLYSTSLNIQKKVYYLDVKETRNGARLLKMTEICRGQSKTRIFVPMSFVPDLNEKLSMFVNYYTGYVSGEEQVEPKSDEERPSQALKSERIIKGNRRFYFDLKHNERGYFLKVTQPSFPYSNRPDIPQRLAIPGEGIVELRDCVAKIMEEYGLDEDDDYPDLPEPKEIRVEHKRFYLDSNANNRGVFVRLSEVTNNYRACVTIPRRGWERLRDSLDELCKLVPDVVEEQNTSLGDYE